MRLAALVFVVLALSGCGSCKKDDAKPSADAAPTDPGPPCRNDASKKLGPNGKVVSCNLMKPYIVDGYTCEWGKTFELYPDGKLKTCFLRESREIEGTTCHDLVSFHPSGKLHRCRVYTTKKGVVPGVDLRAGDWVSYYDSGSVERLELVIKPATIQGVTCKGHENWFYENGKLKKCELAEADGGKSFACFDEQGGRLPTCP